MPHRNGADRANWLRALAGTLPKQTDATLGAMRQTVDTLNEIADYLDTTEPARLPPDTLGVRIHGPALWYFNNEDDTITQARLDTSNDRDVFDERERALCAALIRLAQLHLDEDV